VVTIHSHLTRCEIPVDLSRVDSDAGPLWKVKPDLTLPVAPGVLVLITALLTVSLFVRAAAWTQRGCSLLAGLLPIRGFQKVERAQFCSIANTVVIDIARHAPDCHVHKACVDRVMMQMMLARQNRRQS